MFKSIVTLFRGQAADAVEAITDANAMTILDQQIRECVAAIDGTRKTLALAMAQEKQERARLEKLEARIADLEERARAALAAGDEALAGEAAETIAAMENELTSSRESLDRHEKETLRLRAVVTQAKGRLRELERGRRQAKKTQAVLKLRDCQVTTGQSFKSTLRDAEQTLERLQTRQGELDDAAAALDELDAEATPQSIRDRLADAGFGAPTRTQAQDVLARLKAKPGAKPAPKSG